jgi:hypothetical protein
MRPSGAPAFFVWRGERFVVRDLLDIWTDAGSWWDGEGEATFFRLTVDEGTVVELMLDGCGIWRLYRIYD